MPRLRQLFTGRYASAGAVNSEFEQLVRYLNTAELGNKTLAELMSQVFDESGDISLPLSFRYDATEGLQVRWGEEAPWMTLAAPSQLRGPAGQSVGLIDPLQPVTGLMLEADYVTGGSLRFDKLSIPDGQISLSKVANLPAELDRRPRVFLTPVDPGGSARGGDLWIDNSDPAKAVLKYSDGVNWIGGDVGSLIPLPSPLNAFSYLRVNSTGTGYELASFTLPNVLTTASVAQPGGVAPLDSSRKVNEFYLPTGILRDAIVGSIQGNVANGTYTVGITAREKSRLDDITLVSTAGTAQVSFVVGPTDVTIQTAVSTTPVTVPLSWEVDASASSVLFKLRVENQSALAGLAWHIGRKITG
jgi:hypothetical protein